MKRKLHVKTKLLLALALTFFSLAGFAQINVQVGTGTGTQANSGHTPYSTNWEDGKVQYLILKSELNALNLRAGSINSLAFNVTATSAQTVNGFTIKMAHTTATSLTGYITGGFTTCYVSPSTFNPTVGWNTYAFTNPFIYNDQSNIVIEVCFDNAAYAGNKTVQSTTTTFNSVFGTYMDGGTGCAPGNLANNAGTTTNRPNMRFDYFPNISGNNIGVMSIDSPTTFCSNIQNIYATVGNFGVNQVYSFNVNWSINGVIQTPVSSTTMLDTIGGTGPSSLQVLLGSYNFPNNTSSLIKVWTSDPNFQLDTVRNNDTAQVTKAIAMGGLYTIGATGNYPNINAAVTDLKSKGVCAPVYFTVAPGTYNGQVVIEGPIAGLSAVNTITFDGQNKNNCILTHAWTAGDYATVVIKSPFTTVRNFSINATGATTGFGISVINSNNVKISNCIVTVPNQQSTNCIPITINGAGNNYFTAGKSDFVEIDSCVTNYGYFAISQYSSSSARSIGLKITNTRINEHRYYGIYSYYNTNNIIDKNVIVGTNLNQTGYGIYAFQLNHDTTYGLNSISNNQIYKSGYYSIYLATAVNTNGYKGRMVNNMIGGHLINQAYYGLYMTSCTNWNIAHNTIINDIPNATATYSAAYFTGGSNLTVVNNIFARKNTSNNATFYGSSAAIFDTLNYNVYYRPDTTTNFAFLGAYYTPTNLIGVGGHNLNSLYTDPGFTNDTTLLVSNSCMNGTPLSYVTTDFYGATRGLSSPTIGADEYAKQTEDISVEAILTPAAPVTAGIQDMTVRVKNQGSNTVTSFNLAYRNNAGLPVVYNWFGTLAPCDTTSITFTGANQITIGPSNNIVVYSYAPNNLLDLNRTNDTIRKNIMLPLSGTYTIGGTNPSFASVAEAAAALKSFGVSGPVVFNVANGTYNGQVAFDGPILGVSDTNTITFNGNNAIIASSSNPIVRFDNVSYITFDSFNVVSPANFGGIGILVTNQSHHLTFTNNKIDVDVNNTTFGSVGFAASAASTSATAVGNNAQYITFTNNEVIGGYYSFTLNGQSSYLNCFGHNISNNIFRDFYIYGAYLSNVDSTIFANNIINRANRTLITTFYGLFMTTARNVKVTGNRIHNAGVGSYTAYPIYLTTSVNSLGYETEFINNSIYNINSTGTIYGYYLLGTRDGVKLFHNTTHLDLSASTGTIRGVWMSTAPNNHEFKNNIISITGSGSGTKHAIYITTTSASFNSDFNAFHMGVSGGANHVGYWTANRTTLANWTTASFKDSNSVSVNPVFVSSANGNLTPLSNNLDNLGTPVGVTTDILGGARSLTTPDIGSYEFTGISGDMSVVSGSLKRSSNCYSNTDSVFITVRNLIGSAVDFGLNPLTVKWVNNGPVNSNGTITLTSGILNPSSDTTIWANNVNMSAPGVFNLTVFIEPNTVNVNAINDTLFNAATLQVRPILSVAQRNFVVTGPNDTVVAQALSPLFPGGSVFFSEICHFKTTSGQPTLGWPTYLLADDYVELTGVPNSDLSGVTMEEWTGTALQHSVTFPTGTLFGPNGTMVIATGQLGTSVPVPGSYYYHSGNTTTHGSGDVRGYILKNQAGVIIDAATYGGYVFPAASGVTSLDWTGTSPGGAGTSGNRLNAPDNNTASVWVNSATSPQDPNVVNANVTAPSPVSLTGFTWNYLGSPIDTLPRTTLGPWTTPGVYTYVASYTNACGTYFDTVFVTAAATVPVKLITFNGKANNTNSDLMWQTASEKNARLFEVHASVDGNNFKQIGEVKARGNSSSTVNYTFTHVDALAKNNKVYYRLKSVDLDGTFEWSNTIIVTANEANNASIDVYPNPFNNDVTVSLIDNTPATIEVVTLEGVNVYNATTNSNSSFANINLTQLTAGVYFIKVTQNGATSVQKLVKQ